MTLGCLITLFLWCPQEASAQFASTIGGNGGTGTAVAATDAGDLVFAGQYSASARYGRPVDFDLQGGSVSAPDGRGSFAARYAPDGTFQWLWFTEGNNFNRTLVYDAAVRPNGGAVLVGAVDGTVDVDPSSGTTNLTGDMNVMVVALSATGALDWAFSLSDGARGEAHGVAVDDAGTIYLTGYSGGRGSDLDFDPGPGTATESFPDGNAFVASYGPDGSYRWAFSLGDDDGLSGTIVRGNGIAVAQGHVYVAGDFSVTVDFGPDTVDGEATAAGGSGADGFVARYDTQSGAFAWVHQYGERGNDFAHAVVPDGSGGAFVGGSALRRPDDGSAEYGQTYLGRINAFGQPVWDLAVGGPRSNGDVQRDEAYDVLLDPTAGEVTIGGQYFADADFDPGTGTTLLGQPAGSDFRSSQAYLATYDLNGGFLRASGFGGTDRDAVRGLSLSAGDLVAAGTVGPGDVPFPEGTSRTVQDNEPFLLRMGAAPLPPIELLVQETIGVSDTPSLQKALQLLVEERIGVLDTPTLSKALQLLVEESIGVRDAPGLAVPGQLAAQVQFVSVGGLVDFSDDIALDIVLSGTSGMTDLTAVLLNEAPQATDGLPKARATNVSVRTSTPKANVGVYRWVVLASTPTFTFDGATEFRFDLAELGASAGITAPEAVEVYHRPTPGQGAFARATTTSYRPDTDELVATGVTALGEFVFVSAANPLPVELGAFTAEAADRQVRLRWETLSETNSARFAVERGVERADSTVERWVRVGSLSAAGTTTKARRYTLTDDQLPFRAERLQYRLRQVDTDGTESISDPVRVALDAPAALRLHAPFPNPAHSVVTLRYELPVQRPVRVEIYDLLGRRTETFEAGVRAAGRVEQVVDVSRLASGTYFLRLVAGPTIRTERLTVVR
jgi:hypothetical protein